MVTRQTSTSIPPRGRAARWLWTSVVAAILALSPLTRPALAANSSDAVRAAARFAHIQQDHTALRAFLARMPKGGDLHVHLSGAVYAERLIAWAKDDKLCVRGGDTIVDPPCDATNTVAVADVLANQNNYDRLVNALSMRWFNPSSAVPSGHDQFFGTFGRFGAATEKRFVDMIVDQLDGYAADHVQYVELMSTFLNWDERDRLIKALGTATDPAAMLAALQQGGLDDVVAAMTRRLADATAKIDARLACGTPQAHPGCSVTYRHIAQINRVSSPSSVFVQTAAAAALIRAGRRDPNSAAASVVAFNFVAPEDNLVALRDYRAQMRTIRFLAGSDVPVSLHAGELWLGLVPPADLTFHIRDAVEVAGARRIGHGVSLAFEHDMDGLLAEMRQRHVAVEINLTSNDVILGVRGKDHPLPTYLAAGVPVVLSTDDAGVSRINLTNEYFRAVRDYRLDYRTLKRIARNSLEFSFLSGADKEKMLRQFDRAVAAFEHSFGKGRTQSPSARRERTRMRPAAAVARRPIEPRERPATSHNGSP